MSTWKWQKASFRGVEFRFRTTSASLGRRNVVHSYPGRDEVYVEDMGRKGREFTFEAFVHGDDYITWRDRLETACEQVKGPGELVHPTRGRMTVAVQDCRPTENIDQRGLAGFSLTFIEAGSADMAGLSVRVDTPSVVDAKGNAAIAASLKGFAIGSLPVGPGGFQVINQPPFVEADALTTITTALDEVTATVRTMLPDMTLLPALNTAARSITNRLTTLLRIPTDLAAELADQIAGIRLVALAPLMAYQALAKLFGFGDSGPAILRTTPARIVQGDNRLSVQALVRRCALVEAAKASARIDYASRDEALVVRDNLVARLEAEATTASDDVYAALLDLRTAVVEDIGARSVNLPRLVSYTPQATLPAVVLAWRLYGDPTRDEEIVSRNRVRHPGFVPGGQTLEVLL